MDVGAGGGGCRGGDGVVAEAPLFIVAGGACELFGAEFGERARAEEVGWVGWAFFAGVIIM